MNRLVIYCDGACSGNPGIGGWAFIAPSMNIEINGHEENTTNNRMEIKACIEALEYVYQHTNFTEVEIITDSQYVVNTMTKGWQKKKNQDLWLNLEDLIINSFNNKVKWTWVKGHSDNEHNKKCDKLAVQAYTEYKKQKEEYLKREAQKEIDKYGSKESILGIENIDISFIPYEKYKVGDNNHIIIYKSDYLDDIYVCELNYLTLLGSGSYKKCKDIIADYKTKM